MINEANLLIQTLDQLVTVYRHLLDVVRKEQAVLVDANLSELAELNASKEKMVIKVKQLESLWMGQAQSLGRVLRLNVEQPNLKQLAEAVTGEQAEKLLNLRSVLTMLVNRIVEINKKNEVLVQSALSHITGAMQAITETLKPNKTYKKGGAIRGDSDGASGRLITKEV